MSIRKNYLLTPGPTPIPDSVRMAMSQAAIHHRSAAFREIMAEVRSGLKELYQTNAEVLIFTASGTGAMEGAVVNLLSPGDRALYVDAGKFGERWGKLLSAYGVHGVAVEVPWGESVDPAEIEARLAADPGIRAVYLQATETSTGVMHPIREIGAIVRKYPDTLLVVDAITGIGVFEIATDAWGLDVVLGGSQKAFMLPPGLSFASVSEKAWRFVREARLPRFYFDWRREHAALLDNQTAFTPAVSLIVGLREVLRMIRQEGYAAVFARHEAIAHGVRRAVEAMGLTLFPTGTPSNAVTAVSMPPNIDGQEVVARMRDEYGITIAGGQDRLKGKIVRFGHIGYFAPTDMIVAIAAFEKTLRTMGHAVPPGAGVAALIETLL